MAAADGGAAKPSQAKPRRSAPAGKPAPQRVRLGVRYWLPPPVTLLARDDLAILAAGAFLVLLLASGSFLALVYRLRAGHREAVRV